MKTLLARLNLMLRYPRLSMILAAKYNTFLVEETEDFLLFAISDKWD